MLLLSNMVPGSLAVIVWGQCTRYQCSSVAAYVSASSSVELVDPLDSRPYPKPKPTA